MPKLLPLPVKPRYQDDKVTLYCADCRDVLPLLRGVDAVVTDPPYGIAHKSHGQIFLSATEINGDEDLKATTALLKAVNGTPICVFASPYNPIPFKWRSLLVWYKGPQVGGGGDMATCWKRDFELVCVANNKPLNGKRDSSLLNFPADVQKPTGHFCEKPVDLMVYLIEKLTNTGGLVLDSFMGSGTTGVACLQTGRQFIGVEIDPYWYDVAERRIRRELTVAAAPTAPDPFDDYPFAEGTCRN
jgi:DNA modification methylase